MPCPLTYMSLCLRFGKLMSALSSLLCFYIRKSTLVNQVKHTLSDKTHWIGAKFENGSARPDFILVSALDSFFGRILKDNTNHHLHTSMRWRIEFAIRSGNSSAIFDVLPNLRTWLTEGSEDNVSPEDSNEQSKLKGTLGSSHRLKFMICKLIGAIACNVKPLVLFLDDIQWADETTVSIFPPPVYTYKLPWLSFSCTISPPSSISFEWY